MNEYFFDDDEVEGKVHEIESENEEDMIVFGCYLMECLAFNKQLDFSQRGVQYLRNRIIDSILSFSQV